MIAVPAVVINWAALVLGAVDTEIDALDENVTKIGVLDNVVTNCAADVEGDAVNDPATRNCPDRLLL